MLHTLFFAFCMSFFKNGVNIGSKLPSLASAKTLEEGAEKQVTESANVISKKWTSTQREKPQTKLNVKKS